LYFNYMLKDAKNKYSFKCNNTEECYEKMIEQYINDSKSGFDICKAYVKDFTNDTFVILNNLNTLYYNFLDKIVFANSNNPCDAAKECLKIYRPFSEICQKGNNKSFCKVLQNFQAQYNDQMNKVTICNEALKYLPSPYGTNMRIIIISLFIITFAISAIIFILYKCTPCGSYIRPRKKKLNKLWNNEGRHLKLKYPLDKSSKTSSGENYQISYNSAEYSL
ncbi:PIR protein, partial [Plasmodium vivax]